MRWQRVTGGGGAALPTDLPPPHPPPYSRRNEALSTQALKNKVSDELVAAKFFADLAFKFNESAADEVVLLTKSRRAMTAKERRKVSGPVKRVGTGASASTRSAAGGAGSTSSRR